MTDETINRLLNGESALSITLGNGNGPDVVSEQRKVFDPLSQSMVRKPEPIKGDVMLKVCIDAGGRSYETSVMLIPGSDSLNQGLFEETLRHLIHFINEGTEVRLDAPPDQGSPTPQ